VNGLTSITGIALAAGIFSISAVAGNNGNGNGAPSGAHYNLNIIGVEKGKTADMDNGNGHVIFVSLGKTDRVTSKIWLTEGPFEVLDANGTDSNGATFQLPANNCEAPVNTGDNPDVDCTNQDTVYTVWVRALGKPGGSAIVNTCRTDSTDVYDDATATDYCSTEQLEVTSETGRGKKSFENVTRELTTICVDWWDDINGVLGQDGLCDTREQLFDYQEDYWWDYDNNGLRLAQLRFYMTP
jgi:hypothetical protein